MERLVEAEWVVKGVKEGDSRREKVAYFYRNTSFRCRLTVRGCVCVNEQVSKNEREREREGQVKKETERVIEADSKYRQLVLMQKEKMKRQIQLCFIHLESAIECYLLDRMTLLAK